MKKIEELEKDIQNLKALVLFKDDTLFEKKIGLSERNGGSTSFRERDR